MGVWSRLSPFWRFQLAGWLAFIVVSFPLKLEMMGSFPAALFLCVVRDGSSFLLTLGLRSIYLRFWSDQIGLMAAVIIAACTIGGLFQAGFFITFHPLLPFRGEIHFTRSMEFNLLYERTGLLFGWSFLYFGVRQYFEGIRRELKLAQAESAQRDAENQLLRAQMNPHFLYNAFNTLLADAGKSAGHLKALIQALAEYLRYSLENRNNDLVPLGNEVDAIRSYLVVEKARFRDELEIECAIDETTKSKLVPGIVIQPLVENAIKYGRMTSPKPFKVRVVTSRPEPGWLRIEISNTGHWIEREGAQIVGGIGLENLRKRLELLYPGTHGFRILTPEGWVTVQVDIPTKE